MASCTYNPGINSSNPYATLTVTESSYNVANNTSVVSWNLKLYRPYNISSSASKAYKVVINGSTVKSGTTTIGGSGTKTIASGTKTISHNADGSKTISFSFSLTFDITWSGTKIGTGSKSGSLKLTTIPRATTPTVSASSVNMGSNVTINMPRASSSFTHTLQYTFAGATTTIGTGLATSKAWTIPITLASSIPNATSGTLTFTCITYNGSTKIGSKTVSITAVVPGTIVPTASVTVSEAVAKVASTFGTYAKGLSKLNVTASGAGSYGSTIKSYRVVANGATYTSASFTTGVLSSSGNMTITATVTDSRGRTATATKTISVANYSNPGISGLSASRVDNSVADNYDNLSVVVKGSVSAINGNNGSYKIDLKKSTDSAYPSTPISTGSLTDYAVNTTVTLNNIDVDSSYNLRLTITDGYGNSTTKVIDVPTAFTLVDYHTSGKGLAFGKVAEKDNYIESALRMSLPSREGTYIAGKDGNNASIQISTQQSPEGYHPYVNIKSKDGHIWNIGGIQNLIGFWGFYSSQTANSWNWSTRWDTSTGEFLHTGKMTVQGALTLSSPMYVPNSNIIFAKNTSGTYVEAVNWCGSGNDLTIGGGNYRNSVGSAYFCGNVLNFLTKTSIVSNKSITVSSDKNLKKDFEYFSDKHDTFFDSLKPTIYKYILDDKEKHFGYIAQEVEDALKIAGLESFAGVSIIPIESRQTTTDENGNTIDMDGSTSNYLLDKGLNEQHNIAYDEFISLNTWQIQKLKAKVQEQQKEIEELKALVNNLIAKVGGCM